MARRKNNEPSQYEQKVNAIREAILNGKKVYVDTYLGKFEVEALNNDIALANNRSWSICSTHVDQWYQEIS